MSHQPFAGMSDGASACLRRSIPVAPAIPAPRLGEERSGPGPLHGPRCRASHGICQSAPADRGDPLPGGHGPGAAAIGAVLADPRAPTALDGAMVLEA